MDTVDIGSVIKLSGDKLAVVIGIIHGAPLGMFYTVLIGDEVREISESQIVSVLND